MMVMRDGVTVRCPFCRGTVTASAEAGAICHTMPTCKAFDDEPDPIEFLKRVNLERANRRGRGLT
jgi:hypothetical protein